MTAREQAAELSRIRQTARDLAAYFGAKDWHTEEGMSQHLRILRIIRGQEPDPRAERRHR